MIENTPQWFETALRVFDRAVEHGVAYSILLGWGISIGLTQLIKMIPWTSSNKWAIRLNALMIGTAVTYSLWPVHSFNAVRLFTAIMVGVSAPWIYWIFMRLLCWKWPHLEKTLSANPDADK